MKAGPRQQWNSSSSNAAGCRACWASGSLRSPRSASPCPFGSEIEYVLSGVAAVILLTGYVVHVGFTGMRTCYVRAIGRPGLEARYSTVWTICNALLTVPLALAAGMVGVVAATAATGVVASAYFVALCRRAEGLPLIFPHARWWLLAAFAACVTIAGELAVLRSGVGGFFGLVLTGVPAFVGLGILAAVERRRAQRPA